MRTSPTVRTGLLAALVGCLVTSACGGSSSTASSASTGTVTVATTLQMSTLDPTRSSNSEINDILFDPLVRISAKGAVEPDLATSWTTNADKSVWTFALRPGVHFQDGSPVTAQDVAWTYTKIKGDPTSPQASNVKAITSVVAQGTDAVVVTLAAANVGFLQLASRVEVVPQKVYESLGPDKFAAAPVGSGPYRVTALQPGASMTLKAWDGYWGGAAKLKDVVFESIPDETTRVNGMRGGAIDATTFTAQGVRTIKGTSGITLNNIPSDKVTFLGYNLRSGPLSSPALREAVSYAIDRKGLTSGLFQGLATPTGQIIAPTAYGYDKSIPVGAYDPVKAKALVAQSGYSGQEITLQYPQGSYVASVDQVVQAIGGQLQAVGINVKLEGVEYSAFLQAWFAKKLTGIYLFGYAGLDAQAGFNLLNTTAFYNDPAINTAYAQQSAQTDETTRLAELGAISKLLNDKAYYTPLYYDAFTYAGDKKVVVPARADGHIQPYDMSPR